MIRQPLHLSLHTKLNQTSSEISHIRQFPTLWPSELQKGDWLETWKVGHMLC